MAGEINCLSITISHHVYLLAHEIILKQELRNPNIKIAFTNTFSEFSQYQERIGRVTKKELGLIVEMYYQLVAMSQCKSNHNRLRLDVQVITATSLNLKKLQTHISFNKIHNLWQQ